MNDEQLARYNAALHAMQSAVAITMERTWTGAPRDAKHLRVGINSAMSDHGALVSLLIKKGVFTEAEYFEEIIAFMEREAESNRHTAIAKCGLPPGTTFA